LLTLRSIANQLSDHHTRCSIGTRCKPP